MINAHTVAAARSRDEIALGLKPNVTRNRDIMLAASMVAAHHDATIVLNDHPNMAVYRSYVVVECYLCGSTVRNGGWQFEHIADDGNGLAGDELATAIANGRENVSKVQFGCGTCNAAKNAERAFNKRLAKAGR